PAWPFSLLLAHAVSRCVPDPFGRSIRLLCCSPVFSSLLSLRIQRNTPIRTGSTIRRDLSQKSRTACAPRRLIGVEVLLDNEGREHRKGGEEWRSRFRSP